jgi:hypothetical protein
MLGGPILLIMQAERFDPREIIRVTRSKFEKKFEWADHRGQQGNQGGGRLKCADGVCPAPTAASVRSK